MDKDTLIELMAKAMRDSEPGMEGKSHLYWIPSAKAVLQSLSSSGYMVVEGWKPIDTAPRDGTEILARDSDGMMDVVAYAWNDSKERPLFSDMSKPARRYSIWMPLPLPPQAQISDEERSDEVDPASNSASLTP